MRFKILFPATVALLLSIMIPSSGIQAQQSTPQDAAYFAFRNAVTDPPPVHTTPIFKLSKNFPATVPDKCPECAWLKIDVNFTPSFDKPSSPNWHGQNWDKYMDAILQYVKEGQDPNLSNEVGYRVEVNHKTRWFNVPWMSYDPTAGREFVHGTTNERTAHLADLVNNSPHASNLYVGETDACKKDWPYGFESWSVGYYNEYGGYAIGRSIPTTGVPKVGTYLGTTVPAGLPFKEGTVVVKILTTNAPEECVPSLKGSPQWQIDRHKVTADKGYECDREVQISRIVQVDVAVVDFRSPTHWVYGTFGFDGSSAGNTFWDHLVPVGLQWGSDPWSFPAVPKTASLSIQQSVIDTDNPLFQHLGCAGRLAGPVDNPQSSCTSCHSSAYAVPNGAPSEMGVNVPPSFGFPGLCENYSLDNASYFQNQTIPQSFPGGRFPTAISMDTSLQLAVAFTQYGYFNTEHAPQACTDPNQVSPTPNPTVLRTNFLRTNAVHKGAK